MVQISLEMLHIVSHPPTLRKSKSCSHRKHRGKPYNRKTVCFVCFTGVLDYRDWLMPLGALVFPWKPGWAMVHSRTVLAVMQAGLGLYVPDVVSGRGVHVRSYTRVSLWLNSTVVLHRMGRKSGREVILNESVCIKSGDPLNANWTIKCCYRNPQLSAQSVGKVHWTPTDF